MDAFTFLSCNSRSFLIATAIIIKLHFFHRVDPYGQFKCHWQLMSFTLNDIKLAV